MISNLTTCSVIVLMLTSGLFCGDEATLAELLSRAETAYEKYDMEANLKFSQEAFAADSQSYEAAWKLSRAYVESGEELTDKDERKVYFRTAEGYARRAVSIDSNGAKGHVFLAVSLGRVALDAGAKERVRLSKEIKSEVDRGLELDPGDDIAWHVLGRWHRKVATLSWIERKFANMFLGGVPKEASVEEAVNCFKKAIEIDPEHINHHLELAITYEELKQKDLAIQEYETVLSLPAVEPDDPAHQQHARERLEKLK